MKPIIPTNANLEELNGKTVIVTGAGGGIGAATARYYHSHGANVVLADLEQMRSSAEAVVASLAESVRATFIAVNILDWGQMNSLFRLAKEKFGTIDVVVANAGVMESSLVLESQEVDETGDLKEPTEAYKVLDINVKGTLNSQFSGSWNLDALKN
jgi:NAD(P)-dependent dehydrogenase (short-subunit alcohol dehydrogenase family)